MIFRIASVQPLTEDHIQEKSQDLSTSGNSIRRRFLEFYAARGHKILPSSSLVPDDPTVLLTIAGMLQFKPVFLGKVFKSPFVIIKNSPRNFVHYLWFWSMLFSGAKTSTKCYNFSKVYTYEWYWKCWQDF